MPEEKKKSLWSKIWSGAKAAYKYLDGKRVTIGWAMTTAGAYVGDPIVKPILLILGGLLGGEGALSNARKGYYGDKTKEMIEKVLPVVSVGTVKVTDKT